MKKLANAISRVQRSTRAQRVILSAAKDLIRPLALLTLTISPVKADAIYWCDDLCKSMLTLNPNGDERLFAALSVELKKYADIIDPYIAVAIAYQESGLRNINSAGENDLGIFQFNKDTIKRFDLNQRKILNDLPYATSHFAKLMRRKRKICSAKYPTTWYACWHSSTPKLHETYAQNLARHLRRMGVEN